MSCAWAESNCALAASSCAGKFFFATSAAYWKPAYCAWAVARLAFAFSTSIRVLRGSIWISAWPLLDELIVRYIEGNDIARNLRRDGHRPAVDEGVVRPPRNRGWRPNIHRQQSRGRRKAPAAQIQDDRTAVLFRGRGRLGCGRGLLRRPPGSSHPRRRGRSVSERDLAMMQRSGFGKDVPPDAPSAPSDDLSKFRLNRTDEFVYGGH